MTGRHGQRSHDEVEPLLAAAALDGLDQDQQDALDRLLADHGPDCEECLRLIAAYGEVAAGLASTVESMPLSDGAEDTLMRQVRRSPSRGVAGRRAAAGRARRWVAAAAVAAALALVGGVIGYSVAPRDGALPERFVAFASEPGTRIVPFPSSNGQQLAVAFRQGRPGGWIIGANLSSPPEGRVYELWFQPGPGAAMRPAGTFVPEDGTVLAPVELGGSFDVIAVSVEPEGGSPQPTTDPVFVASI